MSTVARAAVRASLAWGRASVTFVRRSGSLPQTASTSVGALVVVVVVGLGVWAAPAPAGSRRAMLTAARAPMPIGDD